MYNGNIARARQEKPTLLKGNKKNKKVEKRLDTCPYMCYNKFVVKRTTKYK